MHNKNNLLNLFISGGSQVLIIALGFIVPRVIMTHYGSDTNGLTLTITNVFTCLALLEAGISVAARNALYKPIQENNRNKISYVMSLAKRYYNRITYIYGLFVVGLSIGLPFVLKTNISYWTVLFMILFEGLTNVISFYFVNTWNCIIGATGRQYINDIFRFIQKILCYSVKIILAINYVNIAFIQIGYFLVSLIILFLYYIYMKKNFDWIDYNAAPIADKLPDRQSYVLSEVAWAIFSSADMIIISIFVSTNESSVYSTYSMVFVALNQVLNSIYTAFRYKLGNDYHIGIDRYRVTHDRFNIIFLGCMTTLVCVSYLLIDSFVILYTNGVDDTIYENPYLPVLFSLVYLISWSRTVSGDLIGISGRQRKAVKINIIEMIMNVVLSLILVHGFGIVGVLFATVIALPLKVIYCTYISERIILKRKPYKSIAIILTNFLIFLFVLLIKRKISFFINSISSFILFSFVYLFCVSIIVFLCNYFLYKLFICHDSKMHHN